MTNFIPAPGFALVQTPAQAEQTKSGLYIGTVEVDPASIQRGKLIAVGSPEITPHGIEIPFPFAEGSQIFFSKGMKMEFSEDKNLVLIHRNNVKGCLQ